MLRIVSIAGWIFLLNVIASTFGNASPISNLNGNWKCSSCWVKAENKKVKVNCRASFSQRGKYLNQILKCNAKGVPYNFSSKSKISGRSIKGRWEGASRYGSAHGRSRGVINGNSVIIWFSAPITKGKLLINNYGKIVSIIAYEKIRGSYRKTGKFNLRK